MSTYAPPPRPSYVCETCDGHRKVVLRYAPHVVRTDGRHVPNPGWWLSQEVVCRPCRGTGVLVRAEDAGARARPLSGWGI